MKCKNRKQKTVNENRVRKALAKMLVIVLACAAVVHSPANTDAADKKLQNGSFEEKQEWTSNNYLQADQSAVPFWNTTASDGKIELFRDNSNVYVKNDSGAWVRLTPTEGSYAAELNADEESTLYQTVSTTPSSIYEWGLDHGARNGTDIMALVIGPKQSVAPSKPNKAGRDQFMQMVDWLNIGSNSITAGAVPQQYVVYSKKFSEKGTFEDNAGNNAFSLTPSTIFTEEWHIWIMASDRAKTETVNPWNSYGANAEGSAGINAKAGDTELDLSKYYLYTVPSGQTETLFGFVSVGYINSPTTADKAKTYGNFLDNINFEIYHQLSSSTSNHGSAVVGGSDGTTEGEGSSDGHKVTIDNKLKTYVIDGEALKIQAIVSKADADDGCEFVGLYHTEQDENGNPVTNFLRVAGNEIEDTGSLTDEQKNGKWIKSKNSNGDIVYTYYLENISSATDLHFVFIKSPTITYDPNGGKDYVVERKYNTGEAKNVYSFKPATGEGGAEAETGTMFIDPYVSHAAEGQNAGWKFMGWQLTGDTVDNISGAIQVNADQLGSMILPAEHTVACDYAYSGVNGDSKAQQFNIYKGEVELTKELSHDDKGEVTAVKWKDNGETKVYANVHKGITLVAQWRWLQAFIPQTVKGGTCTDSAEGGTVEIISVTDKSDSNYNAAYNANGGKAYHAAADEKVNIKATAKEGYTFEGWYDESGNLITTNDEYSYTEAKESVKTYYAKFAGNITQTYIRQVKSGSSWNNTEDDKIGTLGRYSYTDAPGMPISSTAAAAAGYKFVGWYDSAGNAVANNMLINNGATISYTTTGNATYYARFETAYTVKFVAQTKQKDGSFKTDNVGGKVSAASVSDVSGATASSTAAANGGYKFIGWYDKDGNQLGTNVAYSKTITADINGVTYYARFEANYKATVNSHVYLSFIAESETTPIPSVFDGRDAGTGKNSGYGNKYGNTISTGFKYSIDNMTDVDTIQITVNVPDTAYVKVDGIGIFYGSGDAILRDTLNVKYNMGCIKKIKAAATYTYYWDASGFEANTEYGFVIDNLYAPGATATITVNGTAGTKVTDDNGVVNATYDGYNNKSYYWQALRKFFN